MKAAVISAAGAVPTFVDFPTYSARRSRASLCERRRLEQSQQKPRRRLATVPETRIPFVPGVDGVGTTADGRRVYFAMPETPYGAMAEQTFVDPRRTVPVPAGLDDVAAAALANPGMSCWAGAGRACPLSTWGDSPDQRCHRFLGKRCRTGGQASWREEGHRHGPSTLQSSCT